MSQIAILHPQGYTDSPAGEAGWSCVECGAWSEALTATGERSPGWAQCLCAACEEVDLERADRQMAERLAEAPCRLDPETDLRTLPLHLEAILSEGPLQDWQPLPEEIEALEDLTPHLEPLEPLP